MGTKVSNIDQLIDELSDQARLLMIQRGSDGAFKTKTLTVDKLKSSLAEAQSESPNLTGTPTAPTPTAESVGGQIATKAYVDDAIENVDADIKWQDTQRMVDLVWVGDKSCLDASGNLYTALRNEIVYISAKWDDPASTDDQLKVIVKPAGGDPITLITITHGSDCRFACPVIINKDDQLYLLRSPTTEVEGTYVKFVSFEFKGIRSDMENSAGSGTGNVTKIIAGANVQLTPPSGTGEVTISVTGGGGGGGGGSAREQYCDGTWRFLKGVTTITDNMFGPVGQTSKAYHWRTHSYTPGWEGSQRGIIAEDLTKINDYGLYNASYLSKLYMPKLKEAGNYAFYDCNEMSGTITLESLEYMGEYCFYHCNGSMPGYEPNFVGVNFPKLKSAGYRSLEACSYMASISVGHGKDETGNYVVELGDTTLLDSLIMNTTKIDPRAAPEQNNILYTAFPNIERQLNTLNFRHLDNSSYLKNIVAPRSQVLCDYCFRSAYQCNHAELQSVLWTGYHALLYLGNSVTGGLGQLDMRSLRYAGVYSMQYINASYFRLDNLIRIGFEAFYNDTTHKVHFYAPNLKRIDYYGLGSNTMLVNSQYKDDDGNVVGASDTLEFPQLEEICQGGFNNCLSIIKLKIPKAKKIGADALSSLRDCTDIYLDDASNYSADELVNRQMDTTSLDDRGLYHTITNYRDNKTIHCKNGETIRWNATDGKWKKTV